MKKLLPLLLITLCWSCTEKSGLEKYQDKRDNVVNVKNKIKEIVIDDVLIDSHVKLYLMGDYLLIEDYRSFDKFIHIFDKKTFKHCASTGNQGEGPSEIGRVGSIGVDENRNKFYVSDHSKLNVFSFDLDSVLADSFYEPHVKMKINPHQFPNDYTYINDTLCIGQIITPIGHNNFKPSVGKWNMNTGKIELMKYEHPEIKKKRINFTVSMENNIYIEYYYHHDLMSIYNLNGDLKHNIYGPNWNSEADRNDYYGNAVVCQDKIIASYSGEDSLIEDENGSKRSNNPKKLLIFDLNGDYIKTLETEYEIISLCYDNDNHRLILNLNEEVQFAYLNLNGLID